MISPHHATFCLLSFEGPDGYAQAGGLGVRITHLAQTLARRGFDSHLLFVGNPDAPGRETRCGSRLTLHRWCQWISAYHRAGVYDGEEGKLRDFTASVPPFILEEIVRPAIAEGRLPVVLAEEWHTAEAASRLRDLLRWPESERLADPAADAERLRAEAAVIRRDLVRAAEARETDTLIIEQLLASFGADLERLVSAIGEILALRQRQPHLSAEELDTVQQAKLVQLLAGLRQKYAAVDMTRIEAGWDPFLDPNSPLCR